MTPPLPALLFKPVTSIIDLMHMTSQKGAPACWVSNEALSRAPSLSMQPAGQPLHDIPPSRPGPAHWLRAPTLQHVHAAWQVLTPQHGAVVMEMWRQCIRSIPNKNRDQWFFYKKGHRLFGIDVTGLNINEGNGCIHHSSRCMVW